MHWGIHTIEDYHAHTHGPLPRFYANLVARAVLAEELGYESFWLTEHHFHWFGGAHANPLVALSAVAARTSRLRVGTAVTLLPYWHPLKVAEDFACLDNLSNGRLDLGVGRGFFKIEYDGLGVPMAESRARFNESLGVIRRAWTEPSMSHAGQFWQFEDVELVPKPVQKPHPPIWVAATVTPESFTAVGQMGLPIMIVPYIAPSIGDLKAKVQLYLDAFRTANHTHAPAILGFFMAYITDDMASLREQIADRIRAYGMVNEEPERKMRGDRDPHQYAHFANLLEKMQYFNFDSLHGGNKAVFGTPEHCAEVIRQWRDEVGVTHLTIMPSWGGLPEEQVRTTMRRFAREVIPQVVASQPSAGLIDECPAGA
jgi:alkanesulfonate monooxygenase SsuD/methylene tetrahydromethanopterin reductase-like flavin-dependent oxidoreductase (luciferase family)